MYSWGGVEQKFPNDEKHFSESFMAYEATKVFRAIARTLPLGGGGGGGVGVRLDLPECFQLNGFNLILWLAPSKKILDGRKWHF